MIISTFVTGTTFAQNSVDVKVDFVKGQQNHFTYNLSHSGSVIVLSEEEDKLQSLPLDVSAKLDFFQLVNGAEQAIRFYQSASAKIKIEKGTSTPSIVDANRLIVARQKSGKGDLVDLASMKDVLSQPEMELLQSPADPLTIADVFNKSDVEKGDKWNPSNAAVAKMFRVHKINESTLQLKLKDIDARQAKIYLMGSINADVDDVTTKMDITGVAIINTQKNILESLKIGIRQVRGPGQIAPGFEGKTKIEIIVSSEKTSQLTRKVLAKHTKDRTIRQRVKWVSAANFVLNYEPRWKMIMGEADAALLRYIDKNELLAQCNLVQLPSRPANNPLTLDAYKKEVAKIVATDKNARLVSASNVPLPSSKNTVMRVIVAGEEEGLPVNWFYYHVAGNDGRQVTFVFTLAESVAKRVSTIATQLVSEFEFQPVPKKVASKKSTTPATRSLAPSRKR